MKTIFNYLKEHLNDESVVESSIKYIRFTPGDLEKASETISSIKSLAQKYNIYVEDIDNGIKLKANAADKEKWASIKDVMQQYVDGLQQDENVDTEKVEKLANQINKLDEWLDSDDEEPKEDDDKNKEDE